MCKLFFNSTPSFVQTNGKSDANDGIQALMNKLIMIIEDDFETQFLFSELLQAEGYDVKSVSNGDEALESLNDSNPDLIFMDLNFPGATPEDFMAALRSKPSSKDVPVVLVSGKSDIATYAEKLQAASFIKKPFELDPLLDLIQKLI